MADLLREPATSGVPYARNGVELVEMPVPGAVNLRGDTADPAFLKRAGGALGAVLPLRPNSVTTAEGYSIIWLGPNEWLVLTAPGAEIAAAAKLSAALSGLHVAVTDISGNRVLLALRGPAARAVLEKGCSLDLDPRVFGIGQSAQTLVARAQVVLLAQPDGFDILPRRSFARYLREWLEDAMLWL